MFLIFCVIITQLTLTISNDREFYINCTLRHNHQSHYCNKLEHKAQKNAKIRSSITTVSEAQVVIDCNSIIDVIKEKQEKCSLNSSAEVDLCVYFASDYNFVIPFLIHHLSLGFSKIYMYNNDEKVAWYNHPTVLCLVAENYVDIQPWFGENVLHKALNHCFKRINENRNTTIQSKNWAAVFDIDEMLVLHNHSCVNNFIDDQKLAPSIAINWAFFTPEYPVSKYGRTGNIRHMPSDVLSRLNHIDAKDQNNVNAINNNALIINNNNNNNNNNSKDNSNNIDIAALTEQQQKDIIVLPHDILIRRMFENEHVKTITRVYCSKNFVNEHCPSFTNECVNMFGNKAVDPQGFYIIFFYYFY
jgi:hypothetical protein